MPSSRETAGSWSAGLGTHRVLLIDDEVVIRRALARYFARQGWVVQEADDGDAARRALAESQGDELDLVICDLRMPQGSGEELYRWLQRHRPELAGRVVFSSGDVLAPEAATFLAEARRPVLPKPFELGDIARVVDEVRGSARAS
jgi:two-component system NtrC family sensor kinase